MTSSGFGIQDSGFRVDELLGQLGVKVETLVSDSRKIKSGDVFCAYPGEQQDGRRYIAQAVAAGAGAVLWEEENFAWDAAWQVPNLPVKNLRGRLGEIASKVCGEPSKKLWMIGITGTNGKTSCSHWLGQSLTGLGRKTAVVGTLGNGFSGELSAAINTTPDPIELHVQLSGYVDSGAQAVAMEVSSHGLVQGRVNGVAFDVAMLTNLSRDHLDYHGDMQSYAQAKAGLFAWPGLRCAVLNLDDEFGASLAARLDQSRVKVIGYGMGKGDVSGSNLRIDANGIRMDVRTPWGDSKIESSLLGAFNAYNLLGVLAVLLVSDVKLDDAVRVLNQVSPPAGRMQRLGGAGKPLVVVDYAHTPDALEKVLQTLRDIRPQAAKLICVFGCGGDRDKGKRPIMGKVASALADSVIVTSDNPRGEEPRTIIDDVLAGMGGNYHVEEDRASAILHAIREAHAGDVVLVAGKGHELYQEIKGVKHPFSDAEVSLRALKEAA
jgi:UDP-N-acetylmuramoyl-L-alanyl-D-glutamate--2,6-diaminopimelate ligase